VLRSSSVRELQFSSVWFMCCEQTFILLEVLHLVVKLKGSVLLTYSQTSSTALSGWSQPRTLKARLTWLRSGGESKARFRIPASCIFKCFLILLLGSDTRCEYICINHRRRLVRDCRYVVYGRNKAGGLTSIVSGQQLTCMGCRWSLYEQQHPQRTRHWPL